MLDTKQRLLEAGLDLLLRCGFNHLGIQTLLTETGIPKGSFYHYFKSKEDFALQVVDRYMDEVHSGLNACLGEESVPPIQRVRNFFEATGNKYSQDGYLGCMLGGLGQELAGVNDVFRHRIDACLGIIGDRVGSCLELAVEQGDLPEDADTHQLAVLLVNCWEGAALRSRLQRSPEPLMAMLDFYFNAAVPKV